jgi:hypothetical protein
MPWTYTTSHNADRNDDTPEPKSDLRRQVDAVVIGGVAGAGAGVITARTLAVLAPATVATGGLVLVPIYVGGAVAYLLGGELYRRSQYVTQHALQARMTRALWRGYQGYVVDWAEMQGRSPEPMPYHDDLSRNFYAPLYEYRVVEQKLAAARHVDLRLRAADCDVEKQVVPTLQGLLIELQRAAGFWTRNDRIGYNADRALQAFEKDMPKDRWYWKVGDIRHALLTWYQTRLVNFTP